MKTILIIFVLTIGMDRVAPESMDNSAMFPFLTSRNLNERNIVMCTYLNCNNKSLANKEYCSKHQRAYNRRNGNFNNYREREYHNLSNTPEFKIWAGIRARCNNPNDTAFRWYGARGIHVCKEWDSFLVFLNDMGKKPHPKAQIDRIDNDSNYSKDNCIWTTNKENNRHTRRTKLDYDKVKQIKSLYFNNKIPMLRLADMFKVGYTTINYVINNKTWAIDN